MGISERQRGREALAASAWEQARASFEADLAREPSADAHDGLGRALWWLGDADAAIDQREQAFVAWKDAGDHAAAARVAIWLAREHRAVYGNDAVGNGWLARAERLLGDAPDDAGRGWLEIARARSELAPEARFRHAEAALELAHATSDPDLEVAALSEVGLALVERGDVGAGLDHLDEAMAAATAGEADLPETIADACCTLVAACERAGDAGRLAQWASIVAGLLERRADLPSLAFCRTCNAEVLAATGRAGEAEAELVRSTSELSAAGHRSRCVDPAVKLAEVRLRQGRVDEAEGLLAGREGLPEAAAPMVQLYLTRSQPTLAVAALLRRINRLGGDELHSAPLRAQLVEAQLAGEDLEGAADTAARLDASAEASGHPMITAFARLSAARLAVARDADPTEDLLAAGDRFDKLGMTVEAATSGLLLAESRRARDPAAAAEDARLAQAAFERVGFDRDADRAAALVRALGGPARTGARAVGTLTAREAEVLDLLAEGLTNAEIASRLYISTKTAGHHVSSILAKLGVTNRAEAAAVARRTGHADRAAR